MKKAVKAARRRVKRRIAELKREGIGGML